MFAYSTLIPKYILLLILYSVDYLEPLVYSTTGTWYQVSYSVYPVYRTEVACEKRNMARVTAYRPTRYCAVLRTRYGTVCTSYSTGT